MGDVDFEEEVEALAVSCIAQLPAGEAKLDEYRRSQAADPTCSAVTNFCKNGWPAKKETPTALMPYWKVRGELSVCGKLLLYQRRIVVPKDLQKEALEKVHAGHQGIHRCRLRARSAIWWPGLSRQIEETVKGCTSCAREFSPRKEPLLPSSLPDYPWQKVASDLFTLKGANYFLVVDYFSRYPEVVKLTSTTSNGIITALKSIFSRHGVPQVLVSDNGPQYASQEFANFANGYDFTHVTSSPHYPQSNGQAERTVQTVKKLIQNTEDPYMALLCYRTTPLSWCDMTPSQLLMGRRLRANLPVWEEQLRPQWPDMEQFRALEKKFKQKQKRDHDHHHRALPLAPIPDDTEVWETTDGHNTPGQVTGRADAHRLYIVDTPGGQVRRNRRHINIQPESTDTPSDNEEPRSIPSPNRILTRSRTGTAIHPPRSFMTHPRRKGDVACVTL